MKKILYILIIIFLATNLTAQENQQGNITEYINIAISNIPGSSPSVYIEPNSSEQAKWREIIQQILAADYEEAHLNAMTIGYKLIKYLDTETAPNEIYYILTKTNNSDNYWGTYIFNANPKRSKLIIQVPHPLYDLNTGKQGFHIFKKTRAHVYMLSNTHRCNSNTFSGCDGITSSCGSSAPYLDSEQAHAVNGTFQLTTYEINNTITNCLFAQPHGFSQGSNDPDIILSNGTKYTPANDYVLTFKNNLLLFDETLTFKIAHIDTDWDRLIARTNTQGRLLNNSTDPCDHNATYSTGKFIHLEQQYNKLRNNRFNWEKVANAMTLTVSEDNLYINEHCLLFDGINDYVQYADDDTLKRMNGAEEYTIEANFFIENQSDITNFDRILHRKNHFAVYLKEDRSLKFAVYSGGSWHYFGTNINVINIGEWNHIAIIRNTSLNSLKIFVNGIDVSNSSSYTGYSLPENSDNDYLYIGKHSDGDRAFKGKIDNVRIKNIAEYPAALHINNTKKYYSDQYTAVMLNFEEGTGSITANSSTNTQNAILGTSETGDDQEPIWEQSLVNIYQINNTNSLSLKTYPNPAKENITIEFLLPFSDKATISVYNITGKKELEISQKYNCKKNHKVNIDIKNLKPGIYILKLKSGNYSTQNKLIIFN